MAPARAVPALPPAMGVKEPFKDFQGCSAGSPTSRGGKRTLQRLSGLSPVTRAHTWLQDGGNSHHPLCWVRGGFPRLLSGLAAGGSEGASRARQDPLPCSNSTGGRGQSSLCSRHTGLEKKNNLQLFLAFILNSPLEFMETHSCLYKPAISRSSPRIPPVSVEPSTHHAEKTTYKSEVKTLPK